MRNNRGSKSPKDNGKGRSKIANPVVPKMVKELPKASVEFLCKKFDAKPSLTTEIIVRHINNDNKAGRFLSATPVKGDKFKLEHPSAGSHIFTIPDFLSTISRLNAA